MTERQNNRVQGMFVSNWEDDDVGVGEQKEDEYTQKVGSMRQISN